MEKRSAAGVCELLNKFFMGKLYPIAFAVIVTLGHVTGLEFYLNFVSLTLAVTALLVCRSVRPMLITIPIFVCQVSRGHSPANPDYSDYYFTEWRLPVLFILGTIAVFAIVFFILRNRLYKRISFRKTALLLPSLLLSVAFLTNGLGSESWRPEAFAFGAGQLLIYLLAFYLFYLGLAEEKNTEELLDYFTYITLVIAYMIIAQMGHMFLFGDVISAEGTIIKENIHLGWTTSNPLGSILVGLIPVLFYGAMKGRRGWLYLLTAFLVYVGAVVTCSRNSLLFGTLMLLVCIIVACLKLGKRRPIFIVTLVLGAVIAVVMAVVMREQLALLLNSFVKYGASDNGRFKLWRYAWDLFEENKLFGAGFFSLDDVYDGVYISISVMPSMAHNTVFELLGSTGIFGLSAYVTYIFESVRICFKKPSLYKTMLGLTVFAIVLESLLDVFVFCFYPMLYPLAALAIICHLEDMQKGQLQAS